MKITTSLNLPADLIKKLDKIQIKEDLSRSTVVEMLLEEAIKKGVKVLKVKYYLELKYVWTCPKCKAKIEDDYKPEDELICDDCGERFEPEEG